ncbi:MAG: ferrous iron transport protein B [Candidatus Thorarchaeota archaeon]|nr:ferrous iron transport protein B [Candidatus Thorarchaeota archaeon]
MSDDQEPFLEFSEEDMADPQIVLADERYKIIGDILSDAYKAGKEKWTISDMLDRVFLHKYLGIPVFLVVMWAMFTFTFEASRVFMSLIELLFDWLGGFTSQIPIPWLASLITDGVLGGVGFILTFVPPIFFLYLAISVLEDTGYLARAAFVMDRWMVKIGLHGRSFIPLLLGFGCSVAAVSASRTVDGEANRLTTILVAPLISCSARLPVYVLLAGIFFPAYAGTIIFFLYIFGIVMAIIMATLFKKFLFKGESSPLVMELPLYQLPTVHGSFRHMWERGVMFLKQAGTYLFIGSLVIWVASSFGPAGYGVPIEQSYVGFLGKLSEPIFAHMGFSWQIVVGLIFGILAKEAVIQSLSIIFAVQGTSGLHAALLGTMTPISAFALMIFVLLYVPCVGTIGAVKKETGSWKWTAFSVTYQMLLAYFIATLVYLIGGLFIG